MAPSSIRLLLMGDSHLGFDLPLRPRVERRRRGPDFLANHERALAMACRGEVDLVVHCGDLFHRPRVPVSLVYQAFRPLLEAAQKGTPVFLVPGNHERSRIPHHRLATHPNLHIFQRPGTRSVEIRGIRVSLSGFPYHRSSVREAFPEILRATAWHRQAADIRFLCIHHCVEGATVGPAGFTFRYAPDVIQGSRIPPAFSAVLSGHIHRHQVLRRDLRGAPLPTPVVYPGSVERTAFAERGEDKGYLLLDAAPCGRGGTLVRHEFVRLPARPMVMKELSPSGGAAPTWRSSDLEAQIHSILADLPPDAVARIRIYGRVTQETRQRLRASHLRRISPRTMNLDILLQEDRRTFSIRDLPMKESKRRSVARDPLPTPAESSRGTTQFALDLDNPSPKSQGI